MKTTYIINSVEDFDKHKFIHGDILKYKCIRCGKDCTINSFTHANIESYKKLMCTSCKHTVNNYENKTRYITSNKTFMVKYGVINPSQIPEVKEDVKNKMHDRYGGYTLASPILRPIVDNTTEEKFGVRNVMKCEKGIELQKESMYEKYGGYTLEVPELAAKSKQTTKELFGNEYYCRTQDFRNKMPEIKMKGVVSFAKSHGIDLSKYDNINSIFQIEEFKELFLQDRLEHPEKYGSKRIMYNNISFDSIPEFCVYIYCIDAWISIIRNPNICLKYLDMYYNETFTYPDFMINERLVEIKGGHYLNPDGTWRFPYKVKKDNNTGKFIPLTEEEKSYMDDLYDRKRICLLQNNVNILYDNNPWVQGCINYVYTTYGKDWIYKYMKSNPLNISYGYGPTDTSEDDEYVTNIYPGVSPFDQKD